MSIIAYGTMVRRQLDLIDAAGNNPTKISQANEKAKENKLVTAVAALLPAEILAFHALVLSVTTVTVNGTTTITRPGPLKWSLVVLVVLAGVMFLIGRGFKDLKGADLFRGLIPPCAVLAWTGIIGISALTPWVMAVDPAWVVICAGALGVVLIAINAKVNPPEAT